MDNRSTDPIIQKIIDWAMKHNSIRVVLLTSTRAIPDAEIDSLSDYDVILVLQDIRPLVDETTWLNEFGQVLITYWDPIHPDPSFGFDMCANVIQYCDGLKIDFNLWPVSLLKQILAASELPAELDAGYQVLLDKDHMTDWMQPATGKGYVPNQPTENTFQALINDFLSDAPYVAKCLWRDELLPAKWCLDYDMKYNYLLKMLEWRLEIEHDWSVPVGNLGKGLKKYLPPEIWTALEQTYAGAEINDNWMALMDTLELFRRVSVEVGENLDYTYPHDLYLQVLAYVENIKAMMIEKEASD